MDRVLQPIDRRLVRGCALAFAIVATIAVYVATIRARSVVSGSERLFVLDDDQMISMRYARSLAEGHGLTWNAGERVEGYTNFGWTLVMAAVHALGAGDGRASLYVQQCAMLASLGVVVVFDRAVARVIADAPVVAAAALVSFAIGSESLFWGVNGYETSLLALLVLGAQALLLAASTSPKPRRDTTFALALLSIVPVVRSDGHAIVATLVAVAFLDRDGEGRDEARDARRPSIAVFFAALAPAVAHLAFRRAYYGAWVPNTYAMKVAGVPGLARLGFRYVLSAARSHAPLVVVCLAGTGLGVGLTKREGRILLAPIVVQAVAMLLVGGDSFDGARFFAPVLPGLFIAAAIVVARASSDAKTRALLATASFGALTLQEGVITPSRLRALVSTNGNALSQAMVGRLIARNTAPSARIAVLTAGAAPYFSRRPAIDLLGKTNAEVARLPWHEGGVLGHGRFDFAASLASCPDLVLTAIPLIDVDFVGARAASSSYYSLYGDPTFVAHYRGHPVDEPTLLAHGATFVCDRSPELSRLHAWVAPD